MTFRNDSSDDESKLKSLEVAVRTRAAMVEITKIAAIADSLDQQLNDYVYLAKKMVDSSLQSERDSAINTDGNMWLQFANNPQEIIGRLRDLLTTLESEQKQLANNKELSQSIKNATDKANEVMTALIKINDKELQKKIQIISQPNSNSPSIKFTHDYTHINQRLAAVYQREIDIAFEEVKQVMVNELVPITDYLKEQGKKHANSKINLKLQKLLQDLNSRTDTLSELNKIEEEIKTIIRENTPIINAKQRENKLATDVGIRLAASGKAMGKALSAQKLHAITQINTKIEKLERDSKKKNNAATITELKNIISLMEHVNDANIIKLQHKLNDNVAGIKKITSFSAWVKNAWRMTNETGIDSARLKSINEIVADAPDTSDIKTNREDADARNLITLARNLNKIDENVSYRRKMINTMMENAKKELTAIEVRLQNPLMTVDINDYKQNTAAMTASLQNSDLNSATDLIKQIGKLTTSLSDIQSKQESQRDQCVADIASLKLINDDYIDPTRKQEALAKLEERKTILDRQINDGKSDYDKTCETLTTLKEESSTLFFTKLFEALPFINQDKESISKYINDEDRIIEELRNFNSNINTTDPKTFMDKISEFSKIEQDVKTKLDQFEETYTQILSRHQSLKPHLEFIASNNLKHVDITNYNDSLEEADTKIKKITDNIKEYYTKLLRKIDDHLDDAKSKKAIISPENITSFQQIKTQLEQRISTLTTGNLHELYEKRNATKSALEAAADAGKPTSSATTSLQTPTFAPAATAGGVGLAMQEVTKPGYQERANKIRSITTEQAALEHIASLPKTNTEDLAELLRNQHLPLRFRLNQITLKAWDNQKIPRDEKAVLLNLTLTMIYSHFDAIKSGLAKIHDEVTDPLIDKYTKSVKSQIEIIRFLQQSKPLNAKSAISFIKQLAETPSDLDRFGDIQGFSDYLSLQHKKPVTPADTSKIALRKSFEQTPDMNQFFKVGGKEGGVNQPGKFGGVYVHPYLVPGESKHRLQRVLFKQDTKGTTIHHDKNIAEVMAGRIMNAVIGDSASSVFFATVPTIDGKPPKLPDETGENVYVGSIFYDEYTDLFKELGFEDRPYDIGNLNKEKFIAGFCEKDSNGNTICKFDNFDAVTAASALVGDFDVHTGNFGVIGTSGARKKLVKIDHGGALRDLEDDIHIHSHTKHIREYPRALKVNPHFAAELDRQASPESTERIHKAINDTIDDLAKFYGPKPITEFARRIGMKVEDASNKAKLLNNLRDYLIHKMEVRQESQKQLSLEIKLSLAIKKDTDGKFIFDQSIYNINDLILENPTYFLKGDFHFRGNDQRSTFGPIKIKNFTDLELSKLINNHVRSNLNALIVHAEETRNPIIYEYILNNQNMVNNLTKEGLHQFKLSYQTTLDNIAKELTATSRRLFMELTNPDSNKTGDEQPENHKKILYAQDNLSEQVAKSILAEKSLSHRALVVERWIAIMEKSLKESDFHTVFAIFQGLRNKAVMSLETTFASLTPEAEIIMSNVSAMLENENMIDPKKISALMREQLKSDKPIIPIFSGIKMLLNNAATKENTVSDIQDHQNRQRQQQSAQSKLEKSRYDALVKKPSAVKTSVDQLRSSALEPKKSSVKKSTQTGVLLQKKSIAFFNQNPATKATSPKKSVAPATSAPESPRAAAASTASAPASLRAPAASTASAPASPRAAAASTTSATASPRAPAASTTSAPASPQTPSWTSVSPSEMHKPLEPEITSETVTSDTVSLPDMITTLSQLLQQFIDVLDKAIVILDRLSAPHESKPVHHSTTSLFDHANSTDTSVTPPNIDDPTKHL